MATPYDGKVALWHWQGEVLAEQTIEDVVRTIKRWAPHVTQLFVKTSDGSDWMSRYDSRSAMAISGPASIRRWVQVLEANGLEFHAWCVPKGKDLTVESNLIIEACNTPGVRSMILDVEAHPGFWQGGKDAIEPFMKRIRRGVGGAFHLGMSIDPRPQHFNAIYPAEWRPFVNSVHPQVYWALFERPVREVMDEAWATWRNYGLPIIPALQGYAPANEIAEARQYVIERHNALGLSYWRLGAIGATEFGVINQPMRAPDGGGTPPPDPNNPHYGKDIVITPADPGFSTGAHGGSGLSSFRSSWGWTSYYKKTERQTSSVWARWDPQLAESGYYEVSVFVPARHASTDNARYKLHGAGRSNDEMQIAIQQSRYFNLWVPLGVFEFDANNPQAGVIFLNDLTGENTREIAFDAVRFRQILGEADQRYYADGYDSPVGTAEERASDDIYPGRWIDTTGYGVRYFRGTSSEAYHTGADLNLNHPYFDADRDAPVYAAASGTVTFANQLLGWGWVIIIRHDPLISSGKVTYGRYAHLQNPRVKPGDRVVRGQQIGTVGNAEGRLSYHLHFDLSHTDALENNPGDWPKLNLNRVLGNYVDPQKFIRENRPRRR